METQWTNNDSLFELTLYNIHSAATWRRRHNDKKLWSGQSLATEYTWYSRSWRWHSAADPHTGEQTLQTNSYYQRSNTVVSTKTRLIHQPHNTTVRICLTNTTIYSLISMFDSLDSFENFLNFGHCSYMTKLNYQTFEPYY